MQGTKVYEDEAKLISSGEEGEILLSPGDERAESPAPAVGVVLYGRRWGMLSILGLLQISNAMNWMSYAPVAQIAADHYDTSTFVINLLSLCFMVIYIPFAFISTWGIKTKGLRYALTLAAFFNALGTVVRYAGDMLFPDPATKLAFQFIGQCMTAAAQPTVLGGTTPLAACWFGDKERATANTIAMLFNPLGIAAASVAVSIIVTTEDQFDQSLLLTMIVAVATLVVTLLFLQRAPPTPPTVVVVNDEVDTFLGGLKKLSQSKAYWQLFLSFGIGVGIVNSILTLLPQIMLPNGYTADDASMASIAFICCGLFGAMVTGITLDNTHWYLSMIKITFFCATGSMAFFTFSNKPDHYAMVLVASGVMGVFCFAILPLALELGVEITYPVCEGTSSGFLWMAGQFFGIIILLGMGSLKDKILETGLNETLGVNATSGDETVEDMTRSMWMAVGCAGLASLILLPMQTKYHRLDAEATARTNELYKRDSSRSLTRPSEVSANRTESVYLSIPDKGHVTQSLN